MFETPKATNKMLSSIFNIYQGALILCCTTTDLRICSTVLFLEFLEFNL